MSATFFPPIFDNAFSPIENLIKKGFPSGDVALNVETNTSNGMKITACGLKENFTGAIKSNLGILYGDKARGITLCSTWKQTNAADFSLTMNNTPISGASVDLTASLGPTNSSSVTGLGVSYLAPNCALYSNYLLSSTASKLRADAVLGKHGFVLGGSLIYNVRDARTMNTSTMGGYISPEFSLLFKWHCLHSEFYLMGIHRVSRHVEVGWKGCTSGDSSQNTLFEVGTKYLVDPNTAVKAKVDNEGNMSVSVAIDVNENFTATLGAKVDTKSFDSNNHVLGAAFNLKL